MKPSLLLTTILCSALLTCPVAVQAQNTASLTLPSPANILSKKNGRPIVVLYDGSNWAPSSNIVNAAFSVMMEGNALEVDYARIDFAEPARTLAPMNVGPLRPVPWQIPAIAVVDDDGKTCALAQGINTVEGVNKFFKALPLVLNASKVRAERFSAAEKASGPEKAKLIGQGLDTLSLRLAALHKERILIIKESDPSDKSGYVAKYGWDRDAFYRRLDEALSKNNTEVLAELNATVEKNLKNSLMTPELRQDFFGVKYAIAKRAENLPQMLQFLDKIIAEDPEGDIAIGARNLKELYTVSVVVPDLQEWTPWYNRDIFCSYELTLPKVKPGKYDLQSGEAGINAPFAFDLSSEAQLEVEGKVIWKGRLNFDTRLWDWNEPTSNGYKMNQELAAAKTAEAKAKIEERKKSWWENGVVHWARPTAADVTITKECQPILKIRMKCRSRWQGESLRTFTWADIHAVRIAEIHKKEAEKATQEKATAAAKAEEQGIINPESEAEALRLLKQMQEGAQGSEEFK